MLLCHCAMFKNTLVTLALYFSNKVLKLKVYDPHKSTRLIVLVALDISLKKLVSDSPKEGRDDRYCVPEYSLIQC